MTTSDTPRMDPQCLSASLQQPGCAAERFKAKVAQLERELSALRREWEDMKHRCSSAKYLIQLVKDTMCEHRDPNSAFYNECESDPCKWCTDAAEAIRTATSS